MKKIMTILAALAVALMLVGCAGLGKGLTTGTKWKKKVTVDGTSISTTYRRFIKPLSTSTKVSAIKTTIAVDKNTVLTTTVDGQDKKAVVGLAFDFHNHGNAANPEYDFVLIGIQPNKDDPGASKFYIERYTDVSKDSAKDADTDMADDEEDLGSKGFDTSTSAMGSYYSFGTTGSPLTIGNTLYSPTDVVSDWNTVPANSYDKDGDNGFEFYVQVKQTSKGTYDIYLGTTRVATYTPIEDAKYKDTNGYRIGKAAVYANAPKGGKVIVKYISDKTETTGLFVDDEDY